MAKNVIDKRGGDEALKADAEELKNIATGPGTASDKAKRAADALKDPGAKGPDKTADGPVTPPTEAPEPVPARPRRPRRRRSRRLPPPAAARRAPRRPSWSAQRPPWLGADRPALVVAPPPADLQVPLARTPRSTKPQRSDQRFRGHVPGLDVRLAAGGAPARVKASREHEPHPLGHAARPRQPGDPAVANVRALELPRTISETLKRPAIPPSSIRHLICCAGATRRRPGVRDVAAARVRCSRASGSTGGGNGARAHPPDHWSSSSGVGSRSTTRAAVGRRTTGGPYPLRTRRGLDAG